MILVRAAPGGAGKGTARMAVVLKINPGFDASYPWREIGTGTRPEPGSGLDYYLAPADKGGEPAGRWAGRGLAALGFTAGQVIDRAVFEPLYGQHLDPRDPTGKTRLGRAAQQFTPEETIFRELAAAEPHATPARLAELRTLAKAQTRPAVPFWDVTVSVSKSITLFYGGLLAAAAQARRSGRRRPGADPTRGRCTGSRRTSPTAPGPPSRKPRSTSAPSCASGSRRRGT